MLDQDTLLQSMVESSTRHACSMLRLHGDLQECASNNLPKYIPGNPLWLIRAFIVKKRKGKKKRRVGKG